jgi:hypothetical protein
MLVTAAFGWKIGHVHCDHYWFMIHESIGPANIVELASSERMFRKPESLQFA